MRTIIFINNVKHMQYNCDQCGMIRTRKFDSNVFTRDYVFCSKECVNESQRSGVLKQKKEKLFLERYGTTNPLGNRDVIERKKRHLQEKYNVDNVSQLDSVKEKKRRTSRRRYGTDSPQQSKEVREKTEATCLERYGSTSYLGTQSCRDDIKKWSQDNFGVDHFMQSTAGQQLIKDAWLEKYGVDNPWKVEEILDKRKKTWQEKLGVDNPGQLDVTRQAHAEWIQKRFSSGEVSSKGENALHELLKVAVSPLPVETQKKIVTGNREVWFIDFYIPHLNTYIQFDGDFWHGHLKLEADMREFAAVFPGSLYETVLKNWEKDRRQDEWFASHGLRIVRVRESDFNADPQGEVARILDRG